MSKKNLHELTDLQLTLMQEVWKRGQASVTAVHDALLEKTGLAKKTVGTMMARLEKLIERTIDAYARAVALSKSPQQQESRARILEQLTALYKNFHNNSDAGLNELISTVLSKPMP